MAFPDLSGVNWGTSGSTSGSADIPANTTAFPGGGASVMANAPAYNQVQQGPYNGDFLNSLLDHVGVQGGDNTMDRLAALGATMVAHAATGNIPFMDAQNQPNSAWGIPSAGVLQQALSGTPPQQQQLGPVGMGKPAQTEQQPVAALPQTQNTQTESDSSSLTYPNANDGGGQPGSLSIIKPQDADPRLIPGYIDPKDVIKTKMDEILQLTRQAQSMQAPTPPTGIMKFGNAILTGLLGAFAQKVGGRFSNAGDTFVKGAMQGAQQKQAADYQQAVNAQQAQQRDLMTQADAKRQEIAQIIGNNADLRKYYETLRGQDIGAYGKRYAADRQYDKGVDVANINAKAKTDAADITAQIWDKRNVTRQMGEILGNLKASANLSPEQTKVLYDSLRNLPGDNPFKGLTDDQIQGIATTLTPAQQAMIDLGKQRVAKSHQLNAIANAYPNLTASQIARNFSMADAARQNAATNEFKALNDGELRESTNQTKAFADILKQTNGAIGGQIKALQDSIKQTTDKEQIKAFNEQIGKLAQQQQENITQSQALEKASSIGESTAKARAGTVMAEFNRYAQRVMASGKGTPEQKKAVIAAWKAQYVDPKLAALGYTGR